MSERAAPFYCPYCGEEDLSPSGQDRGGWECASCNRAFRLSFLGLLTAGLRREPDETGERGVIRDDD
ncbi:hypothetical protein [Streptomyces sp. NPDC057702]|uniref:hypothetical protein n=1 Tax=unclassified Streptomyces TaxID=2593676 RepID=UPI0036796D7B